MRMIDRRKPTLESVIMHIATQFINVLPEDFSSQLNESLGIIGEFLKVDRVYVFEYDFDNNITNNTYEWCATDVEPQIDYLQKVPIDMILHDWVNSHQNGQMVVHEDVMALDKEDMVYKILEPQGVLSICTVPLLYQNELLGFVGFDDIRIKRHWEDHEFKLLTVLAELMVNAMVKQKKDQTLIYLREKAQQASEAKGTFLAHMSHEIRTPLNGIYNAFYLLTQTEYSEEQKKYLEIAEISLGALSSIVNNILDISKIEAGKMEINYKSVDLESELINIFKTIYPSIQKKGLSCYFDYDFSIANEVIVDMDKLRQIVMNLMNNAVKYTEEGSISVRVTLIQKDMNNHVMITVEDTGYGIDQDDLKHLMESFYRAKQQGSASGTGLGLKIVNELTTLLGGTIEISSEIKKGSSFCVTLPITSGDTLMYDQCNLRRALLFCSNHHQHMTLKNMFDSMCFETKFHQPAMAISSFDLLVFVDETMGLYNIKNARKTFGSKDAVTILVSNSNNQNEDVDYVFDYPISRKAIMQRLIQNQPNPTHKNTSRNQFVGHVLVVDDHPLNRDALKTILEKHGLSADLAENGFQALTAVKSNQYDLIFMDIQMPQMDGYETSRNIRRHGDIKANTPIIAVTANAFLSDYDIKMSSFINDVLYKPVRIDELIRVMKKHLSNAITIPSGLKVFNKETFDLIFKDSWDSARVMIEKFTSEYENDLNQLKEAIQKEDFQLTKQKLHYIKGPLTYMAAEQSLYLIDKVMNAKANPSIMVFNQLDSLIKDLVNELTVIAL